MVQELNLVHMYFYMALSISVLSDHLQNSLMAPGSWCSPIWCVHREERRKDFYTLSGKALIERSDNVEGRWWVICKFGQLTLTWKSQRMMFRKIPNHRAWLIVSVLASGLIGVQKCFLWSVDRIPWRTFILILHLNGKYICLWGQKRE